MENVYIIYEEYISSEKGYIHIITYSDNSTYIETINTGND